MRIPLQQENTVVTTAPSEAAYRAAPDIAGRVQAIQNRNISSADQQIQRTQQIFIKTMKRNFDFAKVTQANTSFSAASTDWIQHMADTHQGVDAAGVQVSYNTWAQKERDTISKTLTNPEQQRAFGLHSEQVAAQDSGRAGGWELAQMHKAKNDAAIASVSNAAITVGRNPTALPQVLANVDATMIAVSNLDGDPPQVAAQRKSDAESKVATAAAIALAQSAPAEISGFLKQHGALLTPQVRLYVNEVAKKALFTEQVTHVYDQIASAPEVQQNKILNSITDPQVRLTVEHAIDSNAARLKRQQNINQLDAYNSAMGLVAEQKSLLDVMHSEYWPGIDGSHQVAIERLYGTFKSADSGDP